MYKHLYPFMLHIKCMCTFNRYYSTTYNASGVSKGERIIEMHHIKSHVGESFIYFAKNILQLHSTWKCYMKKLSSSILMIRLIMSCKL